MGKIKTEGCVTLECCDNLRSLGAPRATKILPQTCKTPKSKFPVRLQSSG